MPQHWQLSHYRKVSVHACHSINAKFSETESFHLKRIVKGLHIYPSIHLTIVTRDEHELGKWMFTGFHEP